jgi:hypothetical protein
MPLERTIASIREPAGKETAIIGGENEKDLISPDIWVVDFIPSLSGKASDCCVKLKALRLRDNGRGYSGRVKFT